MSFRTTVQKDLKSTISSYRYKRHIHEMNTEREIRIIEQGTEEARRISKAMASSTASELLDALSNHPKTATELEEETGYPLPTIQYHIGNLLNAGLIRVSCIRYSEKGKPMKLYVAAETILVISPKTKTEDEVRPVLRKYGVTAVGLVIAVSAVVTVCRTLSGSISLPQSASQKLAFDAVNEVVETSEIDPVSVVQYAMSAPEQVPMAAVDSAGDLLTLIPSVLLIFLIISLLILAGLLTHALLGIRRTTNKS